MLHASVITRAAASAIAVLAALGSTPAEAAGPTVVSINLCTDQLLVALADRDQILGLSPYARDRLRSGIAEAAQTLPMVSGSAEEVLVLRPDLVLAGRFTKRATRELLRQHGLRVEEFDVARSIPDAEAQIRRVGDLVGHPDRAASAAAAIERAAATARAAAPAWQAASAERPSVLPLQRRGWVTGGGTLLASLLDAAGLRNAGAAFSRSTGGFVTLERIVALRPDLLLESETGTAEDQGSALLQHPALTRLYPPEKRISLGENRNLSCGGPALAGALDDLAAAVRHLPATATRK